MMVAVTVMRMRMMMMMMMMMMMTMLLTIGGKVDQGGFEPLKFILASFVFCDYLLHGIRYNCYNFYSRNMEWPNSGTNHLPCSNQPHPLQQP